VQPTGILQVLITILSPSLQAIPGVANVHDLHVWSFGTKRVAMTVHLVSDNRDAALEAAQKIAAKHGITHSTIQTEQCGEWWCKGEGAAGNRDQASAPAAIPSNNNPLLHGSGWLLQAAATSPIASSTMST